MRPTIHFASDHAGFSLKNELVAYVRDELGYGVVDHGAYTYDADDDYTNFISQAAQAVHEDPEHTKAIILGGSGQGEAMLANRYSEVRATVYYGHALEIVRLSRVHNDANVLSFGARFVQPEEAKKALALWLATEHSTVEKYNRRIDAAETITQTLSADLAADTLIRSIVPSFPAKTFDELKKTVLLFTGVSAGFQIDIVDGVFASSTSWPFTELDVESAFEQLAELSSSFELEIDCMCTNTDRYLSQFVSLGIARVIIHAGSIRDYESVLDHAHTHGYCIGFAIANSTPMDVVARYAPRFDFVQIMGIENIGVQGQPFDERTLATTARLRSLYPSLEIAIDGSVNKETIPRLLHAGANRFAPGSAVLKAHDPVASYKQLASMIGL